MTRIIRRIAVCVSALTLTAVYALTTHAQAPGGPNEGIKVHGQWSIVVKDESGRTVERRDFKNSLQPQGQTNMARLLSRSQAISEWVVMLSNNGAPGPQPCAINGNQAQCAIAERLSSQLPFSNVDYTPGLTVGLDPANPNQVVLTGTRRATADGTISQVVTMLSLCPVGPPSPTGCTNTQIFSFFSGTTIFSGNFSAVPVKQGQSIDVTVTYSFQ